MAEKKKPKYTAEARFVDADLRYVTVVKPKVKKD